MPSLYRDSFPHNAKVSQFICEQCKFTFYARYKRAKYCSDLCRHNAYLKRKGRIITEILRENPPNVQNEHIRVVGSDWVKIKCKERNIKVTKKELKGMKYGTVMKKSPDFSIKRVNLKTWTIIQTYK